jgi:phosphatidylglycerol:prolipoprotein diacylglycerol transferase
VGLTSVITIGIDPFVRIGPYRATWYGLLFGVAILLGYWMGRRFMTSRGVDWARARGMYWWGAVVAVVGARLYFVLQQPDVGAYLGRPVRILQIWDGGMAGYGGVGAVLLFGLVYCLVRRIPVWTAVDSLGFTFSLPVVLIRIGNLIAGDTIGPVSSLPWAVRYTNAGTYVHGNGVPYQPVAAYEALLGLGAFLVVALLLRRGARPGTAGLAFFAIFATGQFLVFFLRPLPIVALGLRNAQLVSLLILLVYCPANWLARRRWPDAGSPAPQPAG